MPSNTQKTTPKRVADVPFYHYLAAKDMPFMPYVPPQAHSAFAAPSSSNSKSSQEKATPKQDEAASIYSTDSVYQAKKAAKSQSGLKTWLKVRFRSMHQDVTLF